MDPVNYSGLLSGVINPLEMVQASQAGEQYRQQQALQQQALQDQQAARQLAAQREMEKQQMIAEATMPGADPRLLANIGLRFPEVGHEQIKAAAAQMSDAQKQDMVNTVGRSLSFLQSGRGDLALSNLENQRAAYINAGRDTTNLDAFIATVKADPKAAINQAAMILSNAAPEEYQKLQATPAFVQKATAEASKSTTEAQYAEQQQKADIAKKLQEVQRMKDQTDNELAAQKTSRGELEVKQKQLLADLARLRQGNQELPAPLMNKQMEFIDAAAEAGNQAAQARNIIEKLNAAPPSTWSRMTGEWWNNTFGTDYAAFRNEMANMLNKAVVANKPGSGPLSDGDMKFMARGVPSPDASPATLKEFFTNYEQIQRKIEAGANLKAAWVEQNRGYGKLREDLTLDNGAIIPAGTSLTEANKLVGRLIDSGKLSSNNAQSVKATDKGVDYFAKTYGK